MVTATARAFLASIQSFERTLWACLTYPKYFQFRIADQGAKAGDPEFFHLNDALVDQKVMAARVRVFAERSFEGAITAPLGILLLAWVGGRVAGWTTAVAWFSAFCVVELVLARAAYVYRRDAAQKLDAPARGGRLIVLSFLASLGWSSAIFVFWVDAQIETYLGLLTVLVGVSAVCVLIMSSFLMALVTFYGGLLLPPLIHALLMPNPFGLTTAIGLAMLYGLMLLHGSRVGRQLVSDLESSVRNDMLTERLSLALDAAHQDWFDMHPQSGDMIASARYARLQGMVSNDAGNGIQRWLDGMHPDDRAAAQSAFAGGVQSDGAAHAEYRIGSGDGGWQWIRSIGRVVERDASGNALRIIGVHADITESKRVDEQIKLLAFYDHLTSLPNRRLLNDRLQHAIASAGRHKRHGALLMLDIDGFKALNDTQGHDVGDKFLTVVARRIEACTRKTDTVARQGGDEFMVLLESLGDRDEAAVQAKAIAEKTLQAISRPYQLESMSPAGMALTYSHHCTASIGVTLFSDQSGSAEDLMKRADTAMYEAKASGRNAIRFFDADMQEAATSRAMLDNALREAVQKHQFVLYYQPQLDVDGRVTGAEALLRWLHPTLGLVPPDAFISVTESTGLILPIGRFVMESACAQLRAWAARPETAHLSLSINVSAVQFRDPQFMQHTLATIESAGINPRQFKLEVTESLLLNNVDGVIEKMFGLKARGLVFSLDDFGTGYSSLAYLKRLPIDELKIDKSFIRDVLTDANDAVMARTIVALAKSLGLGVIAEGVETEGQRQFLADNGCTVYQGYLYARPMPVDAFEAYMLQWAATRRH